MSTTDILTALVERLDSFVWVPQPPVLWSGDQQQPPNDGMWLVAGYFPNEPVDRVWDNEACTEERGFFQVSVYFRPGPETGMLNPSILADGVIAHFPKGLALGPVRVRKRAWQSPAITLDAGTSYIPVTVPYLGKMQ